MSELITVNCKHIGYELTNVIIPSYTKAVSDGKNVTDIATDLLAYQETPVITLGGIDPVLDSIIAIEITRLNIWEAFKRLRDTVGGFLYFDRDPDDPLVRRIWLKSTIGEDKGQQIRLGKNLTGVTHTTDYMDMANRLYPYGSDGLVLTDKTYTKVDITKSADVTYGYLTLQGLYAAYNGWTGEGDAHPANVSVHTPTGAWVSPTGHTAASGWWQETYAYDGDTDTHAFYPNLSKYATSPYLTFSRAATTSTQVRIYLSFESEYNPTMPVSVEIYYGAAWHIIKEFGVLPTGWNVFTFASQSITGVRVRFYNWNSAPYYVLLKEVQIWDSTGWTDDSANWVQGEDERTLRCDIGDYDADANYVVSYTHAPYLIALDDITDRGNIKDGQADFEASDVDALLALGRSNLTGLKTPVVSIESALIDLSIEENREFEALMLGSTVRVIDEELGIDESAYVMSISKPDLHRPQQVSIEIASKTKDLIDYLKG